MTTLTPTPAAARRLPQARSHSRQQAGSHARPHTAWRGELRPRATAGRRAARRAEPQRLIRGVLGRVLGMTVAAAAVTSALASRALSAGTADLAQVADLSVRGVAVSAVISAAWAFQDRRMLGPGTVERCWLWVAAGLGLAHGTWLAILVPGPLTAQLGTRLATVGATVVLDALLVAVPALLGVRAAASVPDPSVPGATDR